MKALCTDFERRQQGLVFTNITPGVERGLKALNEKVTIAKTPEDLALTVTSKSHVPCDWSTTHFWQDLVSPSPWSLVQFSIILSFLFHHMYCTSLILSRIFILFMTSLVIHLITWILYLLCNLTHTVNSQMPQTIIIPNTIIMYWWFSPLVLQIL